MGTRTSVRIGSLVALAAVLTVLTLSLPASGESLQDTDAQLGEGIWGTSAAWTGEAIYVFGGSSDEGADLETDKIWRVDPTTGQVDQLDTRLPSTRSQVEAVWTGETIYLFGGRGCQNPSNPTDPTACTDVLAFDPAAHDLTDTDVDLPVPGPPVTAVWTGDLAYLFPDNSNEVLRFDPADESLETLDVTFDRDRPGASAVWTGQRALVFGGGETDTIASWDPDSSQVDEMDAKLPTPRNDTAAQWMEDGAYIFGGEREATGAQLDDVLRYDPLGDQIEASGVSFPTGRSAFPAVGNATTAFLVGGETSEGFTDSVTRYRPGNSPPTADFTVDRDTRTVTVNASESTDPDGDIATYAWDFGDGNTTDDQLDAQHTYEFSGTYTIELTVEDEHGRTSTTQNTLHFGNEAPNAAFSVHVSEGTVTVNASDTTDADGYITDHEWDFDDGTEVDGSQEETHTYHDDGDFAITLTVTDQDGATDTVEEGVTIQSYPPQPELNLSVDGWTVNADATGSKDPAGEIVDHRIAWGQIKETTGPTGNHTYNKTGEVAVELTVEDDDGNTESLTRSIEIRDEPPKAAFDTHLEEVTLHVDASNTTDVHGNVTNYTWSWGDDSPEGWGQSSSHHYETPGTYTVHLTARDDAGLAATANRTITVDPQPPIPDINLTRQGQRLIADASASEDPDGTITEYTWTWDDGQPADRTKKATHHYAGPGTYEVQLSLVDNDGRTANATRTVHIEDTPTPPSPRFSLSGDGLTVHADGTASSDPDGEVAEYRWTWGDNATASGPQANHTYAEPGSYKIQLSLVDDEGTSANTTRIVSVPLDTTQAGPEDPQLAIGVDNRTVEVQVTNAAPGDEADYRWAFGDGASAEGPQATHTYLEDGSYEVQLTVAYADGTKSDLTRTVTVDGPERIEGASLSDDSPRPDVQGSPALEQTDDEDRHDSPLGLGWILATLVALVPPAYRRRS